MTWAEMTRDQRREAILPLWQNGATAQSIADALVTSKNAVIGVIHRMPRHKRPAARIRAFNRPPKPAREPRERKPRPAAPPKEISLIPIDATPIGKYDAAFQPLPGASPVALVDLEKGQCRWPVDIDGKTFFCGCGVAENETYCEIHKVVSRAGAEAE